MGNDLSKEKVILFGASSGGENFIKNNKKYEIIGLVDNDLNRVGTELLGFKIDHPKALKSIIFDKIIITSDWVEAIKYQLESDLQISDEKIIIPIKSDCKPPLPFYSESTLKIARKILIEINSLVIKLELEVYVFAGTALGLMRDGDLIAWDDDIDFCVSQSSFLGLKNLLLEYLKKIHENREFNFLFSIQSMNGEDCVLLIDVFSALNSFNKFQISFNKFEESEDFALFPSIALIPKIPIEHFKGASYLRALNENFRAPKNCQDFLTYIYGDWKSPVKDTTVKDYQNRLKSYDTDINSISITKKSVLAYIEPI